VAFLTLEAFLDEGAFQVVVASLTQEASPAEEAFLAEGALLTLEASLAEGASLAEVVLLAEVASQVVEVCQAVLQRCCCCTVDPVWLCQAVVWGWGTSC